MLFHFSARASLCVVGLTVFTACSGVMDGAPTAVATRGDAVAGEAAVAKRGCARCHTSSAGTLAGAVGGKGFAANLTPDEDTGLGGWKDEDIVSAIRDGVDDEQNTLCSAMPRALDLSDAEAANIVAYLRSVKAVSNKVTAKDCKVSPDDAAHHGKLVVEAQHCTACHGKNLAGADASSGGTVFAANITSDVDTGIGSWSAAQLVAAITTGVDDKDGTLCSQMPRFANFTRDEAEGVAAYLATVAPVKHEVPSSTCTSEQPDPLNEGKTYVANRHCTDCHTANLGGAPTCKDGEPANLTSTGLGEWSDQQIITAFRTGVDDEGAMLSSDMPRFSTMGDDEAKAIVAYLRSLPAVIRPGCEADQTTDAGSPEPEDAGPPAVDAGTVVVDAGTSVVDAGSAVVDAGMTGGGCAGSPVVISQIYGGGGNIGALYNADYVELHNRSATSVEVGGWSIQYASAGGTSWKSQLATIPPSTRIGAGAYLLLAIGPVGANGISLPSTAVKLSKLVDMSATNGKVALTRGAVALSGDCPLGGAVVDFVGYGTASCAEGGSAASPLSSTLAAERHFESGPEMACADSDTNASDFSKVAPRPHGSASNVCSCPK